MKSPFSRRASAPAPDSREALPDPGEAELLDALGYPYLPFRVHRPAPSWHPIRDADEIARYLYETADGEPLPRAVHGGRRPSRGTRWRRQRAAGGGQRRRRADPAGGRGAREPVARRVAALLELPPTSDLLASSPPALRAAMTTTPPAALHPHPAFARSLSAFVRLGVAVRPSPGPADAGLPDAHPTYRAVGAALRDADAAVAPLLADSSLLDRAAYELGLFAPLLRAALADAPAVSPGEPDAPGTEFMTVPVVRVVRTLWDWDAFVRDPGAVRPAESDAAWLLHLPPSGPLQVRRLQPLPALLLETCVRPMSRDAVADALAEQVQGDAARLRDVVRAQMDQMFASGLLYARAGDSAGQAIDEMRTLLLADEAPRSGARSLVGVLARTLLGAREYADAAAEAPDEPYRLHLLDLTVDALEQMLGRVRGRNPFSEELDAYWAGTGIETRLRALAPLLRSLEGVLGGVRHSLPPVVVAP